MAKNGYVMLLLIGVVASIMVQGVVVAQTVHVVGDSLGWTVPANADAYDNWAENNTFSVGDILTFNFITNNHDVAEVTKTEYDACTSTNMIGSLITTGPANVTLTSIGEHYYICTIGSHCKNNQKLEITVTAANGSASPTSPTTPSTPDSSSSVVLATVLVTFLSIIMGVFF